MNKGIYLEELIETAPSNFCIGVGGYPEKHFEASSMNEDLTLLKAKVDAGADYIVTQMFYDNKAYFKFVDDCRLTGITIPIIPGIKILSTEAHLRALPKYFYIDIPDALSSNVTGKSKKEIHKIGLEWTLRQVEELIEAKVPCVHFYIMSSAKLVTEVVSNFK